MFMQVFIERAATLFDQCYLVNLYLHSGLYLKSEYPDSKIRYQEANIQLMPLRRPGRTCRVRWSAIKR